MPKRVSDVIEEYLETIYRLQERSGIAKTSDLVAMLNVAPGTITNTIERLERNLLVVHEPYRGVRLTDEGRRIALDVVRRHRLIERLLTDLLEIEWDKAHELACNLEHWIDSEVARRIEHVLGCPRVCPHGNPIPTEDGEIIDEEVYPLTEFKVGERGIVSRIIEETPEFLRYLGELGVKPERSIEIIHKAPQNDPITIKVDGRVQALSHRVASLIMIRRAEG
ncbi:MAG: metal-dependent transcriptional regulator [Candidatus Bathyarchaeia archaeon]|nr:metal-dependent transcriptional regulator [Candidatus Bathyarchaeota archaeon]